MKKLKEFFSSLSLYECEMVAREGTEITLESIDIVFRCCWDVVFYTYFYTQKAFSGLLVRKRKMLPSVP